MNELRKKLKFIIENAHANTINVLLHLVFWGLYFSFLTFIATDKLPLSFVLERNLLIILFNSLVFYINFLWIMPEYFERGDYRSYTMAFFGMLFLAIPLQYIMEVSFFNAPEDVRLFTYTIRYILLIGISDVIFLVLSTLLKMSLSRSYFERKLLELKATKFEAELKFLREQINPHFLFNSINNIYSLSLENSPKTPEMILKLSELLRYMLYDSNQPKVKLESEVRCVHSLLELFQLKYEEKVNVQFVVKGEIKNCLIVPNLFSPLVENAFKHGDIGMNPKAFLLIECVARSGYLYFAVTNSKSMIKRKENEPGGIGIENLKRRFQINYEPSGKLKFTEEKETFKAALIIPMLK